MRLLIYNIAAENGGALSVLNDFYEKFKKDTNNEYIFVLSKAKLLDTSNIKVLNFPWIKKSWFHRVYFDNFIAPGLVKSYKIDKVFSLQNIIIPNVKIPQEVFVHNALPFSKHRFSLSENLYLWIYQNIISAKILNSIKKASKVFVQTEWMKKEVLKKTNVYEDKVVVQSPERLIKIPNMESYKKTDPLTFFYPASGITFKNHKIIIDACLKLKMLKITNYKVFLTIAENENKEITELYQKVIEHNLPVKFLGMIPIQKVYDYYKCSILLFPSYIETVGLPLLEAKVFNSPVIVSDLPFAHEQLKSYDRVYFINENDSSDLVKIMKELIKTENLENE